MAPTDAVLFQMAQKLRRHSLESTAEAGSGHPTSCMSAADILSVLFFSEMRYDPRDPSGHDADVFVLSKGHAAPILWAALKEAGAISEDLLTLRASTARSRAIRRRTCRGCASPRDRSARACARPPAWPGPAGRTAAPGRVLLPDGRRRGGGGLGLGGGPVRVVPRPRQPLRDRRRQPSRPERSHHVRARPRRSTRRASGRSAGRRPRSTATTSPRCVRRFARARETKGKPFARHRAHAEGQGRLVPRGQGRTGTASP